MSDAFLDATDQARSVRRGEVSPSELVEEAVARIELLNPELNAITVTRFDKARAEARSAPDAPFRGVPYVIKDHVLVTEGDLHTQGVAGLRRAGLRINHDSYFIQRMRAAGFVLIAKTNMPELALGATTESLAWGPTRDPWDPMRSTGGSSGGSAAAVASGMVSVAEGTDGAGSVRMPASHCGVIGLKPTRGRISPGPDIPASDGVSGMGTEGIIARTVRDVAALLDVVSGHRSGDAYDAPPPRGPFIDEVGADVKPLRIGVLDQDPAGAAIVDPVCASAVRSTANVLADLGHDVADGFPARLRAGVWPAEFLACVPMLVKREVDRLGELIGRPLTEADVEPATWAMIASPSQPTAAEYAAAIDSLRGFAAAVESWWLDDGWDLLLTPTIRRPRRRSEQVRRPTRRSRTAVQGWRR